MLHWPLLSSHPPTNPSSPPYSLSVHPNTHSTLSLSLSLALSRSGSPAVVNKKGSFVLARPLSLSLSIAQNLVRVVEQTQKNASPHLHQPYCGSTETSESCRSNLHGVGYISWDSGRTPWTSH
mmetsp:Transcript_3824/g.7316  ORF Transcript_3824/g.7316 Transcript_3824/m.7316 type:complete len:123 (-) Transcript_3824:1265-1633(-)